MTSTGSPALAVTGSTGYLGGRVAHELAHRDVALRLLARDPDRAPHLPRAAVVRSRYANDDETRRSLEGVGTLFMVSAAESAERVREHLAFVDAAVAAGVQHIVYTSFYGAAADSTFTLARDHWATEQYIAASGIAHTFLRDNFYLDFLPSLAGDDGVIRGPAGDGRFAPVARDDVARTAAQVLADPEPHADKTYGLTGPEELTMTEVASILSDHTGRSVSFHDETISEAYESRRRWSAPPWQYDAWVSTYTAIANGELSPATADVEAITGRRPLSLMEFLPQR